MNISVACKNRKAMMLAFAVLFSLTLAGCANLEIALGELNSSNSTNGYPVVSNTILQACAAGGAAAVARTLYADVIKGKKRRTKDYTEDATVGIAIGCTAGAVLDNNRKKYKKKSDYYTAEIRTTQALNTELKNVNSHLFSRTADNNKQLKLLQKQKKAAQLDSSAARAAKRTAKADLAWATKQLKNAKASLSTQKSVLTESNSDLSGSARSSLESEVSQLASYVKTLEQEVGYMSNINDSLVKI